VEPLDTLPANDVAAGNAHGLPEHGHRARRGVDRVDFAADRAGETQHRGGAAISVDIDRHADLQVRGRGGRVIAIAVQHLRLHAGGELPAVTNTLPKPVITPLAPIMRGVPDEPLEDPPPPHATRIVAASSATPVPAIKVVRFIALASSFRMAGEKTIDLHAVADNRNFPLVS